jgi:hypothetical protein
MRLRVLVLVLGPILLILVALLALALLAVLVLLALLVLLPSLNLLVPNLFTVELIQGDFYQDSG